MRSKIVGHRRRYGSNWLTVFPDNLEIPWRQLTLQEFLDYDNLFRSSNYTAAEIEDEIFQLVVLESVFTENIDILPAGVVSTVAAQVLQVSGVDSPEQLSEDLHLARQQVQDFITSAVTLICSVFPAYKPEDVFNLKYDVFMVRLAMAEKRLLELGLIIEPLSVIVEGQPTASVVQEELPSQRKRREILEAKKKQIESKLTNLNKTVHPEGVITQDKMRDSALSFVPDLSNDPRDVELNKIRTDRAKVDAIQGLEAIYPEYFKLMKDGQKLTPDVIQSVKGASNQEVKEHHKDYINKVTSGEIKIPVTKPEVKTKTPDKIKVKRR